MDIKSVIVAMVIGLIMCSCESYEPKYSCDTNVDAWVKDHINEIQKMSRASWLEADAEFSIPMYRAFKPEQRISFWREKFREVKQLPWSDTEIAHICKAEQFSESHQNMFYDERLSDEQLDEIELFLYSWAEQAKKEFGWTDDVIISIIASGNKVLDTHGTLKPLKNNISGMTLSATSESCNCHVNSTFTCGMSTTCEKATCDGTTLGCGGFFAWSCDGRCDEP